MAEKSGPRVGLAIVSHSDLIARGVVELAREMAPAVSLVAAGGTDDGGIGTSFSKVAAAIETADAGAGVVIFCDLGSAILTAETARDFLDPKLGARIRIADAPIVEGTIAGAVAAELGGDIDAVSGAAASASASIAPAGAQTTAPATSAATNSYSRTVTLINRDGLHARPAAEFVKLASTFATRVTVNGKDASSLLGIMSLGLLRGADVEIAGGTDAVGAVDALADLIESGFGEDQAV